MTMLDTLKMYFERGRAFQDLIDEEIGQMPLYIWCEEDREPVMRKMAAKKAALTRLTKDVHSLAARAYPAKWNDMTEEGWDMLRKQTEFKQWLDEGDRR